MSHVNGFWEGRPTRLLISLLGPPLLGSGFYVNLMLLGEIFMGHPQDFPALAEIYLLSFWIIPAAFVFIGLQALVCALIMEFVVRRRAKSRLHIVVWSTLLGAASGLTLIGLIGTSVFFAGLGMLVGFLLGLILARDFETVGV